MTTSYRPDPPPAARPDPVRLRVSRPADLLAAVPFLLGFHPAESLVALFCDADRVRLTARYDLAGDLGPGIGELVDRHGFASVVLVAYCSDVEVGRARLEHEAGRLPGVEVVDLLVVDGERWWSLRCRSGCCPPEGTRHAPEEHPLSAEAVWAGLVARPDRRSVVARLSGPPDTELDGLRGCLARQRGRVRGRSVPDRQDALGRAVVDALPRVDPTTVARAPRRLPDDACLELALLVQDVSVRDVACALVTREDAARHVALWQEVVARTPPELAPAPLCLVGIGAWADGNGTLLNGCCDRLRELDPEYPMARLLSDVSRRALPPAWWDAMADGLRRDLGLVR